MKIRTFTGLPEYVDECVNKFTEKVDVIEIQTHAVGKQSITATVIYREGAGE